MTHEEASKNHPGGKKSKPPAKDKQGCIGLAIKMTH